MITLLSRSSATASRACSIYVDGLVCALRNDGRLGRFQKKIHVLNPKQVKKFKESYLEAKIINDDFYEKPWGWELSKIF